MGVTSAQSANLPNENAAPRVVSLDILRGLVMVFMALDHVRDFMTHLRFAPEDMSQTYGWLFFARFLTHFSAPCFFFLAGTGAYLYAQKKGVAATSSFLWKRGLVLILFELTIVFWGWTFMFPLPGLGLLVIWALGVSMIILSLLIRLPVKWVGGIGVSVIVLHHLLDGINAYSMGAWAPVWGILHQLGFYPIGHVQLTPQFQLGVFVLYPLIPWFAVMAAGYAFGAIYQWPAEKRRQWLLRMGFTALLLFAVLRATNVYGNPPAGGQGVAPGPFHIQPTLEKTVILFFNVNKYPASLDFILMTLGPALLLLGWIDGWQPGKSGLGARLGEIMLVFGKVPMFYYVLHLYVTHLVAIAFAAAFHQPFKHLLYGGFFAGRPEPGFGFNLPAIYLAWVISLVILYFPCRWYANYKATHKQWWLSYI